MLLPTVFVLLSSLLATCVSSMAIEKRQAPETIYLSRCENFERIGGWTYWSEVDYFQAGHVSTGAPAETTPDDICRFNSPNQTQSIGWISLENRRSCTFGSGVTFSSTINGDAQSQPDFVQVGTGTNGFNNYRCFKDNKRQLYSRGNGGCQSVYWCQQ